MTLNVDEKKVFPRATFERARLDAEQVECVFGKGFQGAIQYPNFIAHREQQRRLVVLGRLRWLRLTAKDSEASKVGRLILNIGGDDLELVMLRSQTAGNGCKLRGCRRKFSRASIAGNLLCRNSRKICREPPSALGKGL